MELSFPILFYFFLVTEVFLDIISYHGGEGECQKHKRRSITCFLDILLVHRLKLELQFILLNNVFLLGCENYSIFFEMCGDLKPKCYNSESVKRPLIQISKNVL